MRLQHTRLTSHEQLIHPHQGCSCQATRSWCYRQLKTVVIKTFSEFGPDETEKVGPVFDTGRGVSKRFHDDWIQIALFIDGAVCDFYFAQSCVWMLPIMDIAGSRFTCPVSLAKSRLNHLKQKGKARSGNYRGTWYETGKRRKNKTDEGRKRRMKLSVSIAWSRRMPHPCTYCRHWL